MALSLNNLAALLRKTGRIGEAEELYRRALSIYEDDYGLDHPQARTSVCGVSAGLNKTAAPARLSASHCHSEPARTGRHSLLALLRSQRTATAGLQSAQLLLLNCPPPPRRPTSMNAAAPELTVLQEASSYTDLAGPLRWQYGFVESSVYRQP